MRILACAAVITIAASSSWAQSPGDTMTVSEYCLSQSAAERVGRMARDRGINGFIQGIREHCVKRQNTRVTLRTRYWTPGIPVTIWSARVIGRKRTVWILE